MVEAMNPFVSPETVAIEGVEPNLVTLENGMTVNLQNIRMGHIFELSLNQSLQHQCILLTAHIKSLETYPVHKCPYFFLNIVN